MEKHYGPDVNISRQQIEKEIENLLLKAKEICNRITEQLIKTLSKTIELKDCYGFGARCFDLKYETDQLFLYSDRIEMLRSLLYKVNKDNSKDK